MWPQSVFRKRHLCSFHIGVIPLKTERDKDTHVEMASATMTSDGRNCSLRSNYKIYGSLWDFLWQSQDVENRSPQYWCLYLKKKRTMQCRRLFDNINLLLLRLEYALKVLFKKNTMLERCIQRPKLLYLWQKRAYLKAIFIFFIKKYLQTRRSNG